MSMASVLTARARPASAWAMDGAVLLYAVWTSTCHAVMLLGGNVHHLAIASGCVAALGLLGGALFALRRRRRSRADAGPGGEGTPAPAESAPAEVDPRSTWILFALAASAIAVWLVLG